MADFRKWLFALAVVALLAGLTVPASASPNLAEAAVASQSVLQPAVTTHCIVQNLAEDPQTLVPAPGSFSEKANPVAARRSEQRLRITLSTWKEVPFSI